MKPALRHDQSAAPQSLNDFGQIAFRHASHLGDFARCPGPALAGEMDNDAKGIFKSLGKHDSDRDHLNRSMATDIDSKRHSALLRERFAFQRYGKEEQRASAA
jgi:hypothetical protein